MKKYLLMYVLLLSWQTATWAQLNVPRTVDSLKKVLVTLKDTARVNCLNQIAQECLKYSSGWPLSSMARADSSYPFAKQANIEAIQLGYSKGIAYSFARLAACEQFRSNEYKYLGKDPVPAILNKWEEYTKQTIIWAEKINDNELLGFQYWNLSEISTLRKDENTALKYDKKAIYYFHLSGSEAWEAQLCTLLCNSYATKGQIDTEGLDYCQRGLELTQKAIKKNPKADEYDRFFAQLSFINMSDLYKAAGDYEMALKILQKGQEYNIPGSKVTSDMAAEKGKLFQLLGNYDSSLYYLKSFEDKNQNRYLNATIKGQMYLSETYGLTKRYDKALPLINECIDSIGELRWAKKNYSYLLGKALIIAANIYLETNNYTKALNYGKKGIAVLKYYDARPDIMTSYELLSKIYHRLGKNDSAYLYILNYLSLRDSIQNKQLLFQLDKYKRKAEDEKKQGQIGLLNKDNKIKDQQLKQEGLIKKFLIAGFILFSLIGVFIFRTLVLKRKNEKLQNQKQHAELQRQASELEMQALRAQMNPHFIFNCLSSINKFILKNESRAASDYLTRFSRLIRMVLTNSQLSMIPLSDEIEMLRLYLDMERLRFSNSFDYNIVFSNAIEPETIYIPPMILQPFCENAIWHGLMHKEGQGRLDIIMSMHGEQLKCTITDNGIGRAKAAELKSKSGEKQKSFGLKITTERLALFNNEKTVHTFYDSEDVLDGEGNISGTEVTLHIKYKDDIHEPATLK